MLQLLIVFAVVAVVASMAVINVATARQRIALANTAREVVRYLEKTRTDSVKRHAATGSESGVRVVDASTYRVTIDFDNDGALATTETRDLPLPDGVTFNLNPAPSAVAYDWRGRLTASNRITIQNSTGTVNIDLSGGGDISVDSTISLPTITSTPYPTPTTVSASPTPTPSPSPPPPTGVSECFVSSSVTSVTVVKNGRTSANMDITLDVYGNSGTVTLSYDSTSLTVSPTSATISSLGTQTFTVVDKKNGSREYSSDITFDTPCGQKVVTVNVLNN
jgi:Tfp pilus assembly protein FimT